jgi:hypothetical protein
MGQIFQLQSRSGNDGVNRFDDVQPVIARPVNSTGIIDVIQDFTWSGTPLTRYQIEKTPYILLHEFDMTTNAAVATFLYYKNFTSQGLSVARNSLSELVQISSENAFAQSVKSIVDSGTESFNNISNTISNFVTASLRNINGDFTNVNLTDKYLQPYNLLYQRSRTGFRYVFPYTSPRRSVSTDFSTAPSGLLEKSPISAVLETAKSSIEQFASLFTMTSPGAFIEQPKYYNFGNDTEMYQIKFPLINTRDQFTYQRNFELIYLLFYQNRAFRRSVSRVVPPKIYSARIPGITELPFCYMADITVEFLGNRRNVTLENPGPEGGTFNCIIPDAYEVGITIKSLLEPTANMMLSNELQSANFRADPKQILQSIRNSVGIESSTITQFLQPILPPIVRTPIAFTEQLLVNPTISTNGLQNLNRLRGRI